MKGMLCSIILMLATLSPSVFGADTEASAGPRFEIKRFVVKGATLLPPSRIDALLQPHTGAQQDFAAVQRAIRSLERGYSDAGYSAVQVILPEQELRDGIVRLEVTELAVGRLVIEGNRNFDETNIRRTLPAIAPGAAPNVDAIARNLRTANESPAKNTTVLLRQGETPGTVDVLARVSDQKPWRAGITLDTTGTPNTGMYRLAFSAQDANLFNRDQVLSAQYITAPENPRKVTIVGIGYHIPIYSRGDSLDLAYVFSDVNSGQVATSAGNFGISGGGHFTTLRYNLNLARRGNWDNRFIFGADWRQYSNQVLFNGVGTSVVPDLEVHPLSVSYSGRRRTDGDDLSLFLSVIRNIPGGGYGSASALNQAGARPGANPWYTIYRYGASCLRVLPRDWQIRTAMNGQHTNDMLITGEQFGLGGMDSVRGFIEREIANDRGIRASVELYTPDLGVGLDQGIRSRALVFFDHGYINRLRPLAAELRSETISSIGLGLRGSYRDSLTMRLDLGSVMQSGGLQSANDTRLHGSVSMFF